MSNSDTSPLPWSQAYVVADLPNKRAVEFSLAPDAALRQQIATEIGAVSLRKLKFDGHLEPSGKTDWHLSARLGATVVQSCVVTLEPVTTRIEETVQRSFVKSIDEEDQANELEMPEDVTIEAIVSTIDVGQIMQEALILSIPQFPRASDAELSQSNFTEPGITPMSDDDARPFAQLKSLREGLKNDTD